MKALIESWLKAKETERQVVEYRRELEDEIRAMLVIPECFEGTLTTKQEGYTLKVVGRLSRKVDADKIYDIALENGMEDQLSVLLRWKPEINQTAWKSADPRITEMFSAAVTTTPSRPSFSITKE